MTWRNDWNIGLKFILKNQSSRKAVIIILQNDLWYKTGEQTKESQTKQSQTK